MNLRGVGIWQCVYQQIVFSCYNYWAARTQNFQLLEADWKIKTAVRTPTNAVTANATVGRGAVRPKFSRSPLPVVISTVIAAAKPTIANRPSHTSILLPPLALCSHLIDTEVALLAAFVEWEVLWIAGNRNEDTTLWISLHGGHYGEKMVSRSYSTSWMQGNPNLNLHFLISLSALQVEKQFRCWHTRKQNRTCKAHVI